MLANLVALIYGLAIAATIVIAGMLFLLIPLLAMIGFALFLLLYALIGGESLF